jgi:tetratricopeptide (TPR) repeat protein
MYYLRDEQRTAYQIAERLLRRAQRTQDPALLMFAHLALGDSSYQRGELLLAREHLEMAISLYEGERHRPLALRIIGLDPGVNCLSYAAYTLWQLGYPDRALERANEALALAEGLSHPHSLVFAEVFTGFLHLYRREAHPDPGRANRLNSRDCMGGRELLIYSCATSSARVLPGVANDVRLVKREAVFVSGCGRKAAPRSPFAFPCRLGREYCAGCRA